MVLLRNDINAVISLWIRLIKATKEVSPILMNEKQNIYLSQKPGV